MGVERTPTNLIVVEVIETLKREVFLLYLLDHLLWQLLELSQWRHRLPPVVNTDPEHQQSEYQRRKHASAQGRNTRSHSLVNHLAEIHGFVCQLSPAPVEYNLEYGPH